MSAVFGASETAEGRVAVALERIRGDRLGAIVRVRGEALAEARDIDAAVRDGAVPRPLDGVPLTAKEVLAVAGLETTAASRAFVGHPDLRRGGDWREIRSSCRVRGPG